MNTDNSVRDVQVVTFPEVQDTTGALHFLEGSKWFPNGVKRVFWIRTEEEAHRGNHAHKEESQIILAILGKVEVSIRKPGNPPKKFVLDNPSSGLFIPSMHWVETHFSKEAILIGFSDTEFSESDYIRNLEDFERAR